MKSFKFLVFSASVFALVASAIASPANAADPYFSPNRQVWSTDTAGLAYDSGIVLDNGSPCANAFANCNPDTPKTVINSLAPCEANSSIACIKSVEASLDGSTWVTGDYQGERAASWPMYAWPARMDLGLGAARMSNLYKFAGISHSKGDLFEVSPMMQANVQTGHSIDITEISTKVRGVFNNPITPVTFVSHTPGQSGADWMAQMTNCEQDFTQFTTCWQPASMSAHTSFRVALSLPTQPSGWVTGRLAKPAVSFASDSSNSALPTVITVSGEALTTPSLTAQYFEDNAADNAAWNKLTTVFGMPWSNVAMGTDLKPTDIQRFLDGVAQDASLNKATGQSDEWVSMLQWSQQVPDGTGCAAPAGFAGFVGSNALVYSSAIPTYDAATQTFNYQIAAPHQLPDGQTLVGSYSLLLDEAYARCIWGIAGDLGTPSVTVTDTDPTKVVPVTSISVANGLVSVEANGFNFSKVKIATKLTKKEVLISPHKSVKAIKCMFKKNHKKTKTVKAAKCPSGWVKKP